MKIADIRLDKQVSQYIRITAKFIRETDNALTFLLSDVEKAEDEHFLTLFKGNFYSNKTPLFNGYLYDITLNCKSVFFNIIKIRPSRFTKCYSINYVKGKIADIDKNYGEGNYLVLDNGMRLLNKYNEFDLSKLTKKDVYSFKIRVENTVTDKTYEDNKGNKRNYYKLVLVLMEKEEKKNGQTNSGEG